MSRISARYLGKRLVASYLTLLVIMTLLFLLVKSMPGSFISQMRSPGMTAEQIAQLEARWGLNDPIWVQYARFMINYQMGHFGWSINWNVPVWDLIARRLPRTLILFGSVYIVGYVVGPLVGMYLGWWRGTMKDQSLFSGSLFIYSIPVFWVAWLFMWVFNYQLDLLPGKYMVTQFPEFDLTAVNVIVDFLRHLALPAFTVAAITWVGSMLVMRTQMNNVTDADYVYLAKAKGLSERTVIVKHAARNALIPVATSAIVALAFILDGSIIIENVFNWPGMGSVVVTAVIQQDTPVVQAVFFILAILIIIARLLQDVVYTYLDPRIKFGGNE